MPPTTAKLELQYPLYGVWTIFKAPLNFRGHGSISCVKWLPSLYPIYQERETVNAEQRTLQAMSTLGNGPYIEALEEAMVNR